MSAAVTRFPAGAALDNLLGQVDTLTAKRDELDGQPTTKSGWTYAAIGETSDDMWESLDSAGRNAFLRGHGVVVTARKATGADTEYTLRLSDIPAMVESVYPDHYRDTRRKLNDAGLDGTDEALVLAALDREPSRAA